MPKMLVGSCDAKPGDHHHNGHLWKAIRTMKVKYQGEPFFALLDEDTKQRITVDNLWIEVCNPPPIKLMMHDNLDLLKAVLKRDRYRHNTWLLCMTRIHAQN